MESRTNEANSQKKRIILAELQKFGLVNLELRKKLDEDNDIDTSRYYAEALKPIIPDLISKRHDRSIVRLPRLNSADKFQELLSLCYKGELSQEIFQEILNGIDDDVEKNNYEYPTLGNDIYKSLTDIKTIVNNINYITDLNIDSTPAPVDTIATTTASFVIQKEVLQPVTRNNAENKREVKPEVSAKSNKEQAKPMHSQMIYPASYEEAYKKAMSPLEGVIELFRDYCGASSSNYAYLFSFKHSHTATIDNFIKEFINAPVYQQNKNKRNPDDAKHAVTVFLSKLQDALLQAGEPLEPAPKGSLALRILFVQDKFQLDCINVDGLYKTLLEKKLDKKVINRY